MAQRRGGELNTRMQAELVDWLGGLGWKDVTYESGGGECDALSCGRHGEEGHLDLGVGLKQLHQTMTLAACHTAVWGKRGEEGMEG